MPNANDASTTRLPEDTLDAFLEGILKELKNPSDPELLNQIRSAFRKKIPLFSRSYAAALLIFRAAGLSRTGNFTAPTISRSTSRTSGKPAKVQKAAAKVSAKTATKSAGLPKTKAGAARKAKVPAAEAAAGKLIQKTAAVGVIGPATPLFVSMGKRQRLKPADLRALISEKTGIPGDNLGRVRLFDSYCFIDVPEADAARITEAMRDAALHGRSIEVKPAQKRGESKSIGLADDMDKSTTVTGSDLSHASSSDTDAAAHEP